MEKIKKCMEENLSLAVIWQPHQPNYNIKVFCHSCNPSDVWTIYIYTYTHIYTYVYIQSNVRICNHRRTQYSPPMIARRGNLLAAAWSVQEKSLVWRDGDNIGGPRYCYLGSPAAKSPICWERKRGGSQGNSPAFWNFKKIIWGVLIILKRYKNSLDFGRTPNKFENPQKDWKVLPFLLMEEKSF